MENQKKANNRLLFSILIVLLGLLNIILFILFINGLAAIQTFSGGGIGTKQGLVIAGIFLFLLIPFLLLYLSNKKKYEAKRDKLRLIAFIAASIPMVLLYLNISLTKAPFSHEDLKRPLKPETIASTGCNGYSVTTGSDGMIYRSDKGEILLKEAKGSYPKLSGDCSKLIDISTKEGQYSKQSNFLTVFDAAGKTVKSYELDRPFESARIETSPLGGYVELFLKKYENFNEVKLFKTKDLKEIYSFSQGVLPYFWLNENIMVHTYGEMFPDLVQSSLTIETTGIMIKNISSGKSRKIEPKSAADSHQLLGARYGFVFGYSLKYNNKRDKVLKVLYFKVSENKEQPADETEIKKLFPDYQKLVTDWDKLAK